MRKADAAAICGAVLLVHLPGCFRTITSANEGLYAVVAREVVAGHLPYVTAWEAKPPLFFYVLAAAMKIFGASFLALHLLSLAAAIVTALAVAAIGNRFSRDGRAIGLIAGMTCAALFGSDNGTAIEGESLACAFAAPAFALLCAPRLSTRDAALSGLLASLAFGMKVTVAPVCAVIAIATALGGGPLQWTAFIGAALLPVIAAVLPYVATGNTAALVDANVLTVTRRFGVPVPHPPVAEIARQQLEAFFPAWIAVFALPAPWRAEDARGKRIVVLMLAWTIAALLSVALIHEYFGYQWTTAMPPAALLGAWAFVRLRPSKAFAIAVVALTLVAHVTGLYLSLRAPDPFSVEAAYLRTLPRAERTSLYVATDNAGLYLLAGAPLPTRYPDGAHLYSRDMQAASGSPGEREIARILSHHPAVVAVDSDIVNTAPAKTYLDREIRRHYRLAFAVENHQIWLLPADREFKRSSSRP